MEKQINALKVIALDARIRAYLAENDPKALEQVEGAIREAEGQNMEMFGGFTVKATPKHIQEAMTYLTAIEYRMWMDACNGNLPNIHYTHFEGAEQRFLAVGEWEQS